VTSAGRRRTAAARFPAWSFGRGQLAVEVREFESRPKVREPEGGGDRAVHDTAQRVATVESELPSI